MAIYEVVLEGRQGTDDMLTVLHYDITGVLPPDWQAMANVIRVHLADHMAALCANYITWEGITVREDIPGSVGLFIPFELGTLTGSVANPDTITQVCMLVTKQTGTLTRPTQGRIFQGGISCDFAAAAGNWTVDAQEPVNDFWEDVRVIDFAGPSTATMVVKASNPSAPNTVPYNPVVSLTVSPNPVVQRRRKRGSGS